MTEIASSLEIGDFYVEYAQRFLGEGDVSLQWIPVFQDVRQDRGAFRRRAASPV